VKRFLELKNMFESVKPDLIWSWGGAEAFYAILMGLIFKVKHVNGSVRHGIVKINFHQVSRAIFLHLSRYIVANSYSGLKSNWLKRGFVLYNGLENKFFEKPDDVQSIRGEFNISDDKIILLTIANLVPYKDYETVLRAVDNIRKKGVKFHYLAVGEGKERKYIEKIIEKMKLCNHVTFPGSRSDIRSLLYASDIYIHSSFGEGCSNSILEAMSAGLPVIATNSGGTKEIVDISNGRLFNPGDIKQLAEHILEMVMDEPLRIRLGENSRKKARDFFSVDKMIANYYEIIEEIMR
jgi:glycosyltransferase involved in cell wall biosynthesis